MLPVIVPGCVGVELMVTANVLILLVPHELFAYTTIDPPEVPEVTVILVEVEVPFQPDGNTQE